MNIMTTVDPLFILVSFIFIISISTTPSRSHELMDSDIPFADVTAKRPSQTSMGERPSIAHLQTFRLQTSRLTRIEEYSHCQFERQHAQM